MIGNTEGLYYRCVDFGFSDDEERNELTAFGKAGDTLFVTIEPSDNVFLVDLSFCQNKDVEIFYKTEHHRNWARELYKRLRELTHSPRTIVVSGFKGTLVFNRDMKEQRMFTFENGRLEMMEREGDSGEWHIVDSWTIPEEHDLNRLSAWTQPTRSE